MSSICTICCENIEENDVVKTKCGHEFHFSCLLKNMEKNNLTGDKCPICRKVLNEKKKKKKRTNEVLRRRISGQEIMQNRIQRFTNLLEERSRSRLRFRGRRFNYTDSFRRYHLQNQMISVLREKQIKKEKIVESVKKLSYKEIKEKLKSKGKSTRGYLRSTIEKRLINVLLVE